MNALEQRRQSRINQENKRRLEQNIVESQRQIQEIQRPQEQETRYQVGKTLYTKEEIDQATKLIERGKTSAAQGDSRLMTLINKLKGKPIETSENMSVAPKNDVGGNQLNQSTKENIQRDVLERQKQQGGVYITTPQGIKEVKGLNEVQDYQSRNTGTPPKAYSENPISMERKEQRYEKLTSPLSSDFNPEENTRIIKQNLKNLGADVYRLPRKIGESVGELQEKTGILPEGVTIYQPPVNKFGIRKNPIEVNQSPYLEPRTILTPEQTKKVGGIIGENAPLFFANTPARIGFLGATGLSAFVLGNEIGLTERERTQGLVYASPFLLETSGVLPVAKFLGREYKVLGNRFVSSAERIGKEKAKDFIEFEKQLFFDVRAKKGSSQVVQIVERKISDRERLKRLIEKAEEEYKKGKLKEFLKKTTKEIKTQNAREGFSKFVKELENRELVRGYYYNSNTNKIINEKVIQADVLISSPIIENKPIKPPKIIKTRSKPIESPIISPEIIEIRTPSMVGRGSSLSESQLPRPSFAPEEEIINIPNLPRQPQVEMIKQEISPKVITLEKEKVRTKAIPNLRTKQLETQVDKQVLKTKSNQLIKFEQPQVSKSKQSLAIREVLLLKTNQAQQQKQQFKTEQLLKIRQRLKQRTRLKPKEKFDFGFPFPEVSLLTPTQKKEKANNLLFKVFGRRKGKDILLGTTKTQEEAETKLLKFLEGTIGASGKISKDNQELKFGELRLLRGKEFRPSKREQNRIVQERGFRLGTRSEVRDINFAKRNKRFKL